MSKECGSEFPCPCDDPSCELDAHDLEHYCGCDECGDIGMQASDGWKYSLETGVLLCDVCYYRRGETYYDDQEEI